LEQLALQEQCRGKEGVVMSVEEKLDDFIRQYKNDREQDLRTSTFDKYQNLAFIAWGFALATLALAISKINNNTTEASAVVTVIFWLIGFFYLVRMWHVKKQSE
jgi:hypothetical protein